MARASRQLRPPRRPDVKQHNGSKNTHNNVDETSDNDDNKIDDDDDNDNAVSSHDERDSSPESPADLSDEWSPTPLRSASRRTVKRSTRTKANDRSAMDLDAADQPRTARLGPVAAYNKKRRYSTDLSSYADSPASSIEYETKGRRKTRVPARRAGTTAIILRGGKRKTSHALKTTLSRQSARKKSTAPPPWQTLPYHILQEIFTYAVHPLPSYGYSGSHLRWLLDVACLCRNFTEPALSVLYQSPPLLPPSCGLRLSRLLESPVGTKLYGYRNKVHHLEIEVIQTLAYSGGGRLDLTSLIRFTPCLRDLNLVCLDDGPPFRYIERNPRWKYPDQLFTTLEETGIRLRSWSWNARMCPRGHTLPRMKEIHLLGAFQGLVCLDVLNFGHAQSPSEAEIAAEGVKLTGAISLLPCLRRLTLVYCHVVDGPFLLRLPNCLTAVTMINCPEVSSADLERYLEAHGAPLRELTLKHNPSLNLEFITSLGRSCPRLEVLSMDFQYFCAHGILICALAAYDILLLPTQVPVWPRALITLELVYLRQWSVETAEMFLRSLIRSAPDLPHLRRLVLKTILKIGWRDRADFRDEWLPRLKRVFLQYPAQASHHLAPSSRSGPDEQAAQTETEYESDDGASRRNTDHARRTRSGKAPRNRSNAIPAASSPPTLRRSLRLAKNEPDYRTPSSGADTEPDLGSDDVPLRQKQHVSGSAGVTTEAGPLTPVRSSGSRRTRTELERLALAAGADRPDSSLARRQRTQIEHEAGRHQSPTPTADVEEVRQGMCDVVELRVDNMRPTENQYQEDDFLDEEMSGDESWDGEDMEVECHRWISGGSECGLGERRMERGKCS